MNRADCTFVDTWLDAWIAGRLPADAARKVEQHVRECDRCRRLAAVVRDQEIEQPGGRDAGTPDDFLSAVVAQTSGSSCSRAAGLLPGLVDGELDADSRDMLEAHLAHCQPCSKLRAVLSEAHALLPSLADIQPPPELMASVLAATSRRPSRSALAEWWLRVLARPRASLELAYVATVLIVVLLGNPVAAFYEARSEAGRLAGAVPVSQLTEQLPAPDAALGVMARIIGSAATVVNAVTTEVVQRWRQAQMLLAEAQATLAKAFDWLAHVDWRELLVGLQRSLQPRAEPAAGGQQPKQ